MLHIWHVWKYINGVMQISSIPGLELQSCKYRVLNVIKEQIVFHLTDYMELTYEQSHCSTSVTENIPNVYVLARTISNSSQSSVLRLLDLLTDSPAHILQL